MANIWLRRSAAVVVEVWLNKTVASLTFISKFKESSYRLFHGKSRCIPLLWSVRDEWSVKLICLVEICIVQKNACVTVWKSFWSLNDNYLIPKYCVISKFHLFRMWSCWQSHKQIPIVFYWQKHSFLLNLIKSEKNTISPISSRYFLRPIYKIRF